LGPQWKKEKERRGNKERRARKEEEGWKEEKINQEFVEPFDIQ
jgi:hypothetical protein